MWEEAPYCTAVYIAYDSGVYIVNDGSRNFMASVPTTIAKPVPLLVLLYVIYYLITKYLLSK